MYCTSKFGNSKNEFLLDLLTTVNNIGCEALPFLFLDEPELANVEVHLKTRRKGKISSIGGCVGANLLYDYSYCKLIKSIHIF